jgi:drug/metabolite transporter (DMT)-like permease
MLCGGVQFGLMYLAYLSAFAYIPSHLVALFSVFTPIYVVLFHDLGRRRFHPAYLAAAFLSVAGAALIKAGGAFAGSLWTGFLLMQAAGLAFAGGQVFYRNWRQRRPEGADREYMGWLYLGALVVAAGASLAATDGRQLPASPGQWAVLAYLGTVASGLGFFLWNAGAVRARPATLAACNNLVIPLAMLVSLLLFREAAGMGPGELVRLAAGAALIGAAVFLGERAGGGRRDGGEAGGARGFE